LYPESHQENDVSIESNDTSSAQQHTAYTTGTCISKNCPRQLVRNIQYRKIGMYRDTTATGAPWQSHEPHRSMSISTGVAAGRITHA
jgi:hypothetical protein